eukprot:scaffold9027_cov174-Amphora_coffeaeformis.AAC.3
MAAMFAGATSFGADLSQWNVGQVEDFFGMFAFIPLFNSDLSSWQLRSARDVSFMFQQATSFNQNLCAWGRSLGPSVNTDDIFALSGCPFTGNPDFSLSSPGPFCFECGDTDTAPQTSAPTVPPPECFSELSQLALAVDDYLLDPSGSLTAGKYGHPIGAWCVSSMGGFDSLFSTRRNPLVATFNEDISGWQVIGSRSFFSMFEGAREFNQDISGWDVSNSVDFRAMFSDCALFNQDLSQWRMTNAEFVQFMFSGATSFDQDLSAWDVSNVLFFSGMFQSATRFNGNLSPWDTRSGTSFSFMFENALSFSSDVSSWNTARGTSMRGMFRNATSFNSDLSQWDVGRARDTALMFTDASNFNADLSSWDIRNIGNMDAMFSGSQSFNQNLCGWGTQIRSTAIVTKAFSQSACPVPDEPDLSVDPPGPFYILLTSRQQATCSERGFSGIEVGRYHTAAGGCEQKRTSHDERDFFQRIVLSYHTPELRFLRVVSGRMHDLTTWRPIEQQDEDQPILPKGMLKPLPMKAFAYVKSKNMKKAKKNGPLDQFYLRKNATKAMKKRPDRASQVGDQFGYHKRVVGDARRIRPDRTSLVRQGYPGEVVKDGLSLGPPKKPGERRIRPAQGLKVPTPIIVLSLPKSGTSSLFQYFTCGGVYAAHTFGLDRTTRKTYRIGARFRKNVRNGLPMLANTEPAWEDFYVEHRARIRDLVQKHPTLHHLEFDLTDPTVGQQLEDFTGISHQCWGDCKPNMKCHYKTPLNTTAGNAILGRIRSCATDPDEDTSVLDGWIVVKEPSVRKTWK